MVVSILPIFTCFSSPLLCFFLIANLNTLHYLIYLTPMTCKRASSPGFWRVSNNFPRPSLQWSLVAGGPNLVRSVVVHSLWLIPALALCSSCRLPLGVALRSLMLVHGLTGFSAVGFCPLLLLGSWYVTFLFLQFGPIHVSATCRIWQLVVRLSDIISDCSARLHSRVVWPSYPVP